MAAVPASSSTIEVDEAPRTGEVGAAGGVGKRSAQINFYRPGGPVIGRSSVRGSRRDHSPGANWAGSNRGASGIDVLDASRVGSFANAVLHEPVSCALGWNSCWIMILSVLERRWRESAKAYALRAAAIPDRRN